MTYEQLSADKLIEVKAEAATLLTMKQFALACEGRTQEEVYELWSAISKELMNEIYYTFWTPEENPEPARSALRQLGARYVVDELMNY
jgi:hypothetical protein